MTSAVGTSGTAITSRVHSLNRPNMVSVGTIVWLSSELMFFAGLFAMYFTARAQAAGDWPPHPTELNLYQAVPVTLVLTALSLIFAIMIGLPAGVAAATARGRWPDLAIRGVALLGLSTEGRYPALDLTPQGQKQLTLAALVEQLEGLAAAQPVLLAYEDVHWSDPTTQELLGLIIDQVPTAPLLTLMTARPEFSAPWAPRSHLTQLMVGRLSHPQVGEMVQRLASGKALPAEVLAQVIAKTDGVPLFVEELVKMLLESGLLPEGSLQLVIGGTGDLLDRLEGQDVVTFTGSADTADQWILPATRMMNITVSTPVMTVMAVCMRMIRSKPITPPKMVSPTTTIIATIFVLRQSYEQSIAAALTRMLATSVSFAICLVSLVFLPFHWARVNDLTSDRLDPTSRMPEFKTCAVAVAPVVPQGGQP